MTTISKIEAISPLDGRYRSKVEELKHYFSEYALQKFRIKVEIEYFIFLMEQGLFTIPANILSKRSLLRVIYASFNIHEAEEIKKIESTTNHDVKAVEYYIKEKLKKYGLNDYLEYVHFGLTSQDINSTSTSLMMMKSMESVMLPNLNNLLTKINNLSQDYLNIPMLSRTHGQAASPTYLGKEFLVFHERLNNQMEYLQQIKYTTKFGGATGNMNAHYFTDDTKDWSTLFDKFISGLSQHHSLKLIRNQFTTQIDHYDNYSVLFDNLNRICVLLIDFCVDIWYYISLGYFKQKIIAGEVGSSTMPHKVNPINFENAEGNFYLASSVFQFLSRKLPISRLQRDLTDSTITRNIGTGFGYMLLAIKSCLTGLNKLQVDTNQITSDLNKNYVVITEGIQTLLRHRGISNPYEAMKNITRTNQDNSSDNNEIKNKINEYLETIDISDEDKQKIKELLPTTYCGKKL